MPGVSEKPPAIGEADVPSGGGGYAESLRHIVWGQNSLSSQKREVRRNIGILL